MDKNFETSLAPRSNFTGKFNQIWQNRKQIYLDLLKDKELVKSKQKYFDASMRSLMGKVRRNYIIGFMTSNKTKMNHRRKIQSEDLEYRGRKRKNSLTHLLNKKMERRNDVLEKARSRVKKSKKIIERIRTEVGSRRLKLRSFKENSTNSLPGKKGRKSTVEKETKDLNILFKALFKFVNKKLEENKEKEPVIQLEIPKKKKKVNFFMKLEKGDRKKGKEKFTTLARIQAKEKAKRRNISFKRRRKRRVKRFIRDTKTLDDAEISSKKLKKTLRGASEIIDRKRKKPLKSKPQKDFESFLMKVYPHYYNNFEVENSGTKWKLLKRDIKILKPDLI